jgi:hypothetical protein
MIKIIKLSLAAKLRNGIAVALAAVFLPLPFFPLSIRINMREITTMLGDYGALSTLCTIFIAEAIVSMWMGRPFSIFLILPVGRKNLEQETH